MKRVKRTTENFIKNSIDIFGEGTYNYDQTIFVNSKEKVKIYCNAHKEYFFVTPNKHLNSKQGCQLCSYEKYRSKAKTKDTSYFVDKAKEIHGNIYDYSNTIYTVARNKLSILCNCCGNIFEQVASTHLSGAGCPKCSHDRGMDKQRHSTKTFIDASKVIHGNLYSFEKTSYGKNNMDKVVVTCTICNTDALVIPSNFLLGAKPSCSCDKHYGFQESKPGILYYLSINNGEAYKIGITNKSVKDRYTNSDLNKIITIKEWYFESGYDARAFETGILNKHKEHKYTGPSLLSSGNSELFNVNILSLYSCDKTFLSTGDVLNKSSNNSVLKPS